MLAEYYAPKVSKEDIGGERPGEIYPHVICQKPWTHCPTGKERHQQRAPRNAAKALQAQGGVVFAERGNQALIVETLEENL
jgi:hypothetical protein